MGFLDSVVNNPVVQAGVSMFAPPVGAAMAQGQQNQANWDLTQLANQQNQASADKSMAFTSEQAAREMAFQRDMSNTSHQREVADLKAAGLNPLLSANSGASTPGGASGSGAQASNMAPEYGSPLGAGINRAAADAQLAVSLMSTASQMKLQNAQARNYEANTVKTGVDTQVARKGIPAADATNSIWDFGKTLFQRWKSNSSKSSEQQQREHNQRQIMEHRNRVKIGRPK